MQIDNADAATHRHILKPLPVFTPLLRVSVAGGAIVGIESQLVSRIVVENNRLHCRYFAVGRIVDGDQYDVAGATQISDTLFERLRCGLEVTDHNKKRTGWRHA